MFFIVFKGILCIHGKGGISDHVRLGCGCAGSAGWTGRIIGIGFWLAIAPVPGTVFAVGATATCETGLGFGAAIGAAGSGGRFGLGKIVFARIIFSGFELALSGGIVKLLLSLARITFGLLLNGDFLRGFWNQSLFGLFGPLFIWVFFGSCFQDPRAISSFFLNQFLFPDF